jgi:hypothetical protein
MAAKKKTAPKKKEVAEAPKEKKLGVFDIISELSYGKDDLLRSADDVEVAVKSYNAFLTNKSFSFHLSSIFDANIMNQMAHVDPLLQHDYYMHSLRREKRFSKWFKQEENSTLNILAQHYNVNLKRAQEIMNTLNAEQIEKIVNIYENKGGVHKK